MVNKHKQIELITSAKVKYTYSMIPMICKYDSKKLEDKLDDKNQEGDQSILYLLLATSKDAWTHGEVSHFSISTHACTHTNTHTHTHTTHTHTHLVYEVGDDTLNLVDVHVLLSQVLQSTHERRQWQLVSA